MQLLNMLCPLAENPASQSCQLKMKSKLDFTMYRPRRKVKKILQLLRDAGSIVLEQIAKHRGSHLNNSTFNNARKPTALSVEGKDLMKYSISFVENVFGPRPHTNRFR